jgi:hypothetical protein
VWLVSAAVEVLTRVTTVPHRRHEHRRNSFGRGATGLAMALNIVYPTFLPIPYTTATNWYSLLPGSSQSVAYNAHPRTAILIVTPLLCRGGMARRGPCPQERASLRAVSPHFGRKGRDRREAGPFSRPGLSPHQCRPYPIRSSIWNF